MSSKHLNALSFVFIGILVGGLVGGYAYQRGFQIGFQTGYAWEGTNNTISAGYVEGFDANLTNVFGTNYYLSGTDVTQRLQGNWGSTGIQNTDWMNASQIDTSEIYLDGDNRTQVLEGDFTSGIGVQTDWLELGGSNRTAWPTGGSLDFARLSVDYVIYYNSTDSTYKGLNGSTGGIDYSNANPETTIEQVWSALSGGGSFATVGPGETWTVQSTVDSQNTYVTWYSDWGLTIKAKDNLNTYVIYCDDDYVVFDGLHIHGNRANQGDPATYQLDGIKTQNADYILIQNCLIEEVKRFGIWYKGIDGTLANGSKIHHNKFINCQWNGIQVGGYARFNTISENYIENSADVGITIMGQFNTIENNVVKYIDMTGGSADSAWGYGAECVVAIAKYNKYDGNIAVNCKVGMAFASDTEHNEWSDGIIINEDVQVGAWGKMIWMQGSKNRVKDTELIDLSGATQDQGILVNGDYNVIEGMKFVGLARAIRVGPAGSDNNTIVDNHYFESVDLGLLLDGDYNWIDDNDFVGCTTDVTDNASNNSYGYNRAQDGTWTEGTEPTP